MDEVSFYVAADLRPAFDKVFDRAMNLLEIRGHKPDGVCLRMDLSACHANGCPLDFERLAEADDFNLLHDVVGITRHISRETGQLTGHFMPRFRLREKGGA